MRPIGGYFELELRKGEEYHKNAIRLNTGRNALEYILHAKKYKKVYIPYYTCEVMLEPIYKLNLGFEFYHINEQLEPLFNYDKIGIDEAFIYINYYGIKSFATKELSNICPNLIIDNSQAFFEKPPIGIDTFYSPRKFFGLPDGAYLYTEESINTKFPFDNSVARFSHLIKRIDERPEQGYANFKANEDSLKDQPIKLMSRLTKALLCSIDYDKVIKARKQNFQFLNEHIGESNELDLPIDNDLVPMVFPYLIKNGKNLKQKLIQEGIFVATYWPSVFKNLKKGEFEYYLAEQNVCLPIDQRYGIKEMKNIIKILT